MTVSLAQLLFSLTKRLKKTNCDRYTRNYLFTAH